MLFLWMIRVPSPVEIRIIPYELKFRHPFRIALGMRYATPVVFVALRQGAWTGYGEAALPPYLPDTQESVLNFFSLVKPTGLTMPADFEKLLTYVQSLAPGNFPAKAALDMALHDLFGKLTGQPVYRLWLAGSPLTPLNSFTIAMDTPDVTALKIKEAKEFRLLKVKLGGPHDNLIIRTIRELTDKKLGVDANQGWTDEYFALDMIQWLAEQQVVFVEQPLPKHEKKKQAWLRSRSPLPLIGDESVQGFDDLSGAPDLFHGINIKLMKCGGLREAYRMIQQAKKDDLKILIGCMSESSCGIGAAAQLSPFADWTDLDGPQLISNDPFTGISCEDGRLQLSEAFGTGVKPVDNGFFGLKEIRP